MIPCSIGLLAGGKYRREPSPPTNNTTAEYPALQGVPAMDALQNETWLDQYWTVFLL
jgi:hypothetical protein